MSDANRDDATRYRWLLAKMQEAYDGNDVDMNEIIIGCRMEYGHRQERCVQGLIRWIDVRDEPINLSAAIDKAIDQEMRKETK